MPSKLSLGLLTVTFTGVRPGLLDLKKILRASRGPNSPRCSIAFAVVARARARAYQGRYTLRAKLREFVGHELGNRNAKIQFSCGPLLNKLTL